jgi:diguanylate cyclase (GGDEF)-like protein
VNVEPPPWETPWAYALYVAGFLWLIFVVWNQQHKKLRREESYAKRLSQDVRDRTLELALRNEQLELANQQLRVASLTDPLTGLGNRRYVQDVVGGLIVDLDYLKPINDAHGHQAGDKLIIDVANILRETCRPTDFVARWGGDEFVVVLRDQDIDAAAEMAERIRVRVAKQPFRLPTGTTERSSCSIGFSRYPFVRESPGLLSWEQCLAVADAALYHVKKQRNGWLGWAGTAAAARMTAIVRLLESESAQLERDGYLDVRRAPFRPEDSFTHLRARRRIDA